MNKKYCPMIIFDHLSPKMVAKVASTRNRHIMRRLLETMGTCDVTRDVTSARSHGSERNPPAATVGFKDANANRELE